MKHLRQFLISIVILTLLVVSISTVFKILQREDSNEPLSPRADISIGKVSFREMEDDRIKWELEADRAEYFKEPDLMVFSDVRVTFYSKNGSMYTLQGKEGRYKKATGDMEVSGDVVGRMSEGYDIRATSLKYKAKEKLLLTEDRVVITGSDLRIEGVGLMVDIEKNLFSLKDKVTTSLSLRENL